MTVLTEEVSIYLEVLTGEIDLLGLEAQEPDQCRLDPPGAELQQGQHSYPRCHPPTHWIMQLVAGIPSAETLKRCWQIAACYNLFSSDMED